MSLINGVRVTTSNVWLYVTWTVSLHEFFPQLSHFLRILFSEHQKTHHRRRLFRFHILYACAYIFKSKSSCRISTHFMFDQARYYLKCCQLVKSLYLSKFANRAIWSKVLLLRSKLWQANTAPRKSGKVNE